MYVPIIPLSSSTILVIAVNETNAATKKKIIGNTLPIVATLFESDLYDTYPSFVSRFNTYIFTFRSSSFFSASFISFSASTIFLFASSFLSLNLSSFCLSSFLPLSIFVCAESSFAWVVFLVFSNVCFWFSKFFNPLLYSSKPEFNSFLYPWSVLFSCSSFALPCINVCILVIASCGADTLCKYSKYLFKSVRPVPSRAFCSANINFCSSAFSCASASFSSFCFWSKVDFVESNVVLALFIWLSYSFILLLKFCFWVFSSFCESSSFVFPFAISCSAFFNSFLASWTSFLASSILLFASSYKSLYFVSANTSVFSFTSSLIFSISSIYSSEVLFLLFVVTFAYMFVYSSIENASSRTIANPDILPSTSVVLPLDIATYKGLLAKPTTVYDLTLNTSSNSWFSVFINSIVSPIL